MNLLFYWLFKINIKLIKYYFHLNFKKTMENTENNTKNNLDPLINNNQEYIPFYESEITKNEKSAVNAKVIILKLTTKKFLSNIENSINSKRF